VRLIDGRAIAATIAGEVATATEALRDAGIVPTLAIVVATRDEAAAWYVRSLERAAAKVGVDCRIDQLDDPDGAEITKQLEALSATAGVHGIVCQTPLPAGLRLEEVAQAIDPSKDVDGANPQSLGRLAVSLPCFAPATAAAVLEILRREQVTLVGARAVVVGRSTVVGKPAALLLLKEHATVTVCHSRTRDLASVCAEADILVVAAGQAGLVGAAHVKPGAIVVDVGINPMEDGRVVGDVNAEAVAAHAGGLTPVPGGVGPVTTMLLLRQVINAAAGTHLG
jgi:methylenetetrahydrofolate dehydrogenase (NADP+)/methenyltetrahydrofolate cyclohydrolase